jgi:hypothetical protein
VLQLNIIPSANWVALVRYGFVPTPLDAEHSSDLMCGTAPSPPLPCCKGISFLWEPCACMQRISKHKGIQILKTLQFDYVALLMCELSLTSLETPMSKPSLLYACALRC